MRVVAAIQARMGSTRLPGKVMMEIHGKPMIRHIYDRLLSASLVDNIVIATSTNPQDSVIIKYADDSGIRYFSGSENDLVERMCLTARHFEATSIVRITADCPIVDPAVVDDVLRAFNEGRCEYASNWSTEKRTYPHGFEVEVYSIECLERLMREVQDPVLREWLPLNIQEHKDEYNIRIMHLDRELTCFRLTVDYEEDKLLMEKIFQNLYGDGRVFSMGEVVDFLKDNPEIAAINAKYSHMKGVEDYEEGKHKL